jgi:RNA polymerase sigma-70 factor (ECF subfamily)
LPHDEHDRVRQLPNSEALRQHLLVLRAQAGDERAFTALYERFTERTLRYLTGVLASGLAEDVHQEVWLTVFKRIASVTNPAAFKTWLYQLTRHKAIDAHRSRSRREDRELTIEEAPPAAIESPEEPWSTAERAALKDALPELSSIHREVLVLRYWEGLSYREVAPITGCSVGTVGGATIGNVLALTMPLIAVTGVLSVLIATVSTVGVFLRLRTASLAEIQVRLAALEQMLLEGEVR